MKAKAPFNAATQRELLSVLGDRADVVKELEREAGHYVSYKASLDAIASEAGRRDARARFVRRVRRAAEDLRAAYGGHLAHDLDVVIAGILTRLSDSTPTKAKRGTKYDAARLTLEGNVAAILRRGGVRCTGADKGPLALALGAIYSAVGIDLPKRLGGDAARAAKLDPGF